MTNVSTSLDRLAGILLDAGAPSNAGAAEALAELRAELESAKSLLVPALEHSEPLASHYAEARERHAQALAAARALAS